MQRLRLAEVTVDSLVALEKHLGDSNVKPHLLQEIYEQISDEVKYQGPIYRGVGIPESYFLSFFDDRAFTTQDFTEYKYLESWSASKAQAKKFANRKVLYSEKYPIGAVIQSDTSQQEVVLDLAPPMAKELKKFFEQEHKTHVTDREYRYRLEVAISQVELFEDEEEVIIENPGEVSYTLCGDVIGLYMNMDYLKKKGWNSEEVEAFNNRRAPDAYAFEDLEDLSFTMWFSCQYGELS